MDTGKVTHTYTNVKEFAKKIGIELPYISVPVTNMKGGTIQDDAAVKAVYLCDEQINLNTINDLETLAGLCETYDLHHLKITLPFSMLSAMADSEDEPVQSLISRISQLNILNGQFGVPSLAAAYTAIQSKAAPAENESSSSEPNKIKFELNDSLITITPETTIEQLQIVSKCNGLIAFEVKDKAFTIPPELSPYVDVLMFSDSMTIKAHHIGDIEQKIKEIETLKGIVLNNTTIVGPTTVSQLLKAILHPNFEFVGLHGGDLNRKTDPHVVPVLVDYIKNQAKKLRTLGFSPTAFVYDQQVSIRKALLENKTVTKVVGLKALDTSSLSEHLAKNARNAIERAKTEEKQKSLLAENSAKKQASIELLTSLQAAYESGTVLNNELNPQYREIAKILNSAIFYGSQGAVASNQDNYWLTGKNAFDMGSLLPILRQYHQLVSHSIAIHDQNKNCTEFTANAPMDLKYIFDIVKNHKISYIEKLTITFPLTEATIKYLAKLSAYISVLVFKNTSVNAETATVLETVKQKQQAKSFSIKDINFEKTIMSAETYKTIQSICDLPSKNITFTSNELTTTVATVSGGKFIINGRSAPSLIQDYMDNFPRMASHIELVAGGLLPEEIKSNEVTVKINDVAKFEDFKNFPFAEGAEPKPVKELQIKFGSESKNTQAFKNLLANYHAENLVIDFPITAPMIHVLCDHIENNPYLTVLHTGNINNESSYYLDLTQAVLRCASLEKYKRYNPAWDEGPNSASAAHLFKLGPEQAFPYCYHIVEDILATRKMDELNTIEDVNAKLLQLLSSYQRLAKTIISKEILDVVLEQYKRIADRLLRRWLMLFCKADGDNLVSLIKKLFSIIILADQKNTFFATSNELKEHLINKLNTDDFIYGFIVANIKNHTLDHLLELINSAKALKSSAFKPTGLIGRLDLSPFVDSLLQAIGECLGKELLKLGQDCTSGVIEAALRKEQALNGLEIIDTEENERSISRVAGPLREKSSRQFNEVIAKLQNLYNTNKETRLFFISLISTINAVGIKKLPRVELFHEGMAKFTDLTKATRINGNILNANIRYCQLPPLLQLDSKPALTPLEFNDALAQVSNISRVLSTYDIKDVTNIAGLQFAIIMLFREYPKLFNSKASDDPLESEVELLKLLARWIIVRVLDKPIQDVILGMMQAKIYRIIQRAGKFTSIADIQTAAEDYQVPAPVVDVSGKGKGKLRIAKEDKYYPLAQSVQQVKDLSDLPGIIDAYLAKASELQLDSAFVQGLNTFKQQLIGILPPVAIGQTPGEPTAGGITPGATPGAETEQDPYSAIMTGAESPTSQPEGYCGYPTLPVEPPPAPAPLSFVGQPSAPPPSIGFEYSGQQPAPSAQPVNADSRTPTPST